jgi:hypothetical protein
MTRCPHTGLSIPECSCPACLLDLVRTHAPRPATTAAPLTLPPEDAAADRPQAA